MTELRNLRMLTRYAAWANAVLFQKLSELPDSELTAQRRAVFGTIISTLNHVYVIDLIWQAHLQGREHGFSARNTATYPPFVELRAAQQRIDEWYVGYADTLSQAASDEIVRFIFVSGGAGSMSRADILLHVVNHTTYHRGHVADMLHQIPSPPPATDLPVFLRDVVQIVP